MKKFFQVAIAIKERTALCYTASMCFYMFFLFLFRQEAANLSILFSFLLVSIVAGTMHLVAFSNLLIKKLSYGWRMAVFAVPFFAVLTAVAVGFEWFPMENVKSWMIFVAMFIIIFLAIAAGFELYYRLDGRKYDDRLDWYRQSQKKE